MTTVYKNRIADSPSDRHHMVFKNDFGARGVFESYENARVDIADKGRLEAFVKYAYSTATYDEVRITSLPVIANILLDIAPDNVVYEFHSSTETILKTEVDILNLDKLKHIIVPSLYLQNIIVSMLPSECTVDVKVLPNIVDNSIFFQKQSNMIWDFRKESIPLIWIGRFDKGKNARDFLRALSLLPESYIGLLVVSMETEPERASSFMADVVSYRLDERVHIMMNLSQEEIAALYSYVSGKHGVFVSTSLGESFGYGVAEALACGLDTVAYDVGALAEREPLAGCAYSLVDVGDLSALRQEITRLHDSRVLNRV
ncbi:glycosyltransferase family 4 protein [Paeniglutamicibacter antarcticus]